MLGTKLRIQRVENPLKQLDGVALRGNHEPFVRVELDGLMVYIYIDHSLR